MNDKSHLTTPDGTPLEACGTFQDGRPVYRERTGKPGRPRTWTLVGGRIVPALAAGYAFPTGPRGGDPQERVSTIRISDDLLKPRKYVAEISTFMGKTTYAVQLVGRDEGTEPVWHDAGSVAEARRRIREAVKGL